MQKCVMFWLLIEKKRKEKRRKKKEKRIDLLAPMFTDNSIYNLLYKFTGKELKACNANLTWCLGKKFSLSGLKNPIRQGVLVLLKNMNSFFNLKTTTKFNINIFLPG